ncbi:hypothetical protein NW127_05080 [Staphylococcus pettenkoferi]|uniref:hypothetical protein n=1 Tax=Staphylococcus pettenkoferi TaxID=170573 RepID=UPI00227441B3|nr:hypothetical protein [Staphylococcus pettenkoferi]MCY1576047.1 hypothetical protein [Staphylococcus pettenkoferi]MCY1617684.1 hypothetical protein [Staphylococcus pettenkoferi]
MKVIIIFVSVLIGSFLANKVIKAKNIQSRPKIMLISGGFSAGLAIILYIVVLMISSLF